MEKQQQGPPQGPDTVSQGPGLCFVGHHKTKILSDKGRRRLSDEKGEKKLTKKGKN
jgi:hypothetical protein